MGPDPQGDRAEGLYPNIARKVRGKGHDTKDDFVVLPEPTAKALFAYLGTQGNAPQTAPLFAGEGNRNHGPDRRIRRQPGSGLGFVEQLGLTQELKLGPCGA
jgi:hypothetical protein